MIGIDGSGRDGGGRRKDIPLTYSPYFHFLFLSFSFFSYFPFPSFFSFFCNIFLIDNLKFQRNFHKIRTWRSCFVEF